MHSFHPRRALRRALEPVVELVARVACTRPATLALAAGHLGEMRAVLAGQRAHALNLRGKERANYHLRRAVHRIEKGLSMPERRMVFGLDYIVQATRAYEASARGGGDPEELRWAHDVMSAYFAAVGPHPVIGEAERIFRAVPAPAPAPDPPHAPWPPGTPRRPFPRPAAVPSPVAPAALAALARRRRSVRWFRPEPPSRAALDAALEIARLSPSACNRQPLEFRVFDAPERARRIAALAGGTGGFVEGLPCVIAVVGRLRAYPHGRDRHVIYVDGGLAAMSLMLALETLGLGSCPINWPDIRGAERNMIRALDLAPDERVVMLIAVGIPLETGMIPASAKVSMDLWRRYEDPAPVPVPMEEGRDDTGPYSGAAATVHGEEATEEPEGGIYDAPPVETLRTDPMLGRFDRA